MTTPSNQEYLFDEESAHISRNEQEEINAAAALPESFRLIPLTQGQVAKVSPEDYEWLNGFKWHAWWSTCTQSFYARRKEGRDRFVAMHRSILGLNRGDGQKGDHENSDTLDNRRVNLRIANTSGNQRNCRTRKDNVSGFKGVHYLKKCGRWAAGITVDSKYIHLGRFSSPEEAHAAYCVAADKYHGEFARKS